MKKMLSLVLVLLLTFTALTACGSKDSNSGAGSAKSESIDSLKTIGDVMALEIEDPQWSVYENVVVYAFKLGETYYRVKAPISAETAQAFYDIDYMDEDYETQQKELLTPLEISEIENLNEQMLSQEELDSLSGKTGQELQDAGWTYSGHNLENMEFWMNYGPFLYTVVFDGEVAEADYESFVDEEDTKTLTVKSAKFNALGDATNIDVE